MPSPIDRLRYHVTGAIERGEKTPIVEMAAHITIPDRYTCRGITFLPHGQQFNGSVPAGEYTMGTECDLCYSDLGKPARGRAVPIVGKDSRETWYVGVNVAEFLRTEHRSTK